jgi:hypothetical protein
MLGAIVTASAGAIGIALVAVAVRGLYRRQREGHWAAAAGLAMLITWGLFMLLAAFGLPDSLRDLFAALGLICLGVADFVAHWSRSALAELTLERRLLSLEQQLAEITQRLAS